eukprot:TRINITY_DN79873_c0_g1_i1.p1 TRINITY_DN79873_c0_g1~~TRINITY_DN79873_c0_g1_i1.p1  ORF type:complete len:851 (+),score=210.45 TRINITY_DN79873_c0_g1_i1:87-2639(+)
MATAPLPREIVKWLQSLDLSFSVKNPKRDFTNGYLVAEIMSRYHPKDVDILTYENGSRLEAKLDNWEQLFKLFKKKNVGISKAEFDPVIHCAPGAAILFCHKLYAELTKCQVKVHGPIQELMSTEHEKPPFMRDTASRRLKNEEINRIQDNVERTIVAIDALGYYHQERRQLKAVEAPALILQERRLRMGLSQEESKQEEQMESVQIDEVKVKALQGGEKQMRGETQKQDLPPAVKATGSKIALLKAVTNRNTSVGALASFQYPTLFVKPAMDIMRPLVFKIVEESEELSKMIDSRNQDIVVSFMEQCREGVRDVVGRDSKGDGNRAPPPPVEQRMREIEETSVRVFETLAKRAELLVESLTKSPPEFWKVWNTFYPALTDFSESSPIFESAVFFFKTLGELMRKQEPALTQQLMLEVALPSMAKELARAPEKRDSLCEILYSFTQEDTYNHLLALRALKDKVGDNLPVYVSCLASLISIDASRDLLYDEHLLDLYVYYALVAIQSAQPRIRVAGISILYTITRHSSQHQSVAALIHSFSALAADDWWEVQAQLLRLAAHLLMKLSGERQDTAHSGADDDEGSASATSKAGDAADGESTTDQLLGIINRLFVVSNSKNVLQVGLSSLVHLLPEYPTLLPMFVTVLLEQRPILRQRLLELPPEGQERPRRTYVRGNFTCMYEETCLPQIWPHLDVARTLAMQLEASPLDHFEVEHMEVLLASLPEQFEVVEAEEWLHVFEKVKQYIFIALVDPQLHLYSTQIIKKFWVCPVEKIATGSIEASKRTLEQALRVLYSPGSEERVEEAAVLVFLRELRNRGGEVQIEVEGVVELFKQKYPDEYAASQLDTIFDD